MFWDVLNQRSFLEEDPGNSGRFDEMIREAFGYGWHRRSKADLRAGGQHDASA
jgi:predicted N-acetyltransferase YhbS